MSGPVSPQEKIYYLKCTTTPSNDLAYTNKMYVNPIDFGEKVRYLLIHAKDKSYVYSIETDQRVEAGCIAMNRIQRNTLRASLMKVMEATVFIPPRDDFMLETLTIDVSPLQTLVGTQYRIDAVELENHIKELYAGQVFNMDQQFAFQFEGASYVGTVKNITNFLTSNSTANTNEERGLLDDKTRVIFQKTVGNVAFENVPDANTATKNIFKLGTSFEQMGIGGLDAQLAKMFRRAFASRVYPPSIIKKLQIKHVRGIILYGPPGCGKTLIARQIGKMLNTKDPKIVNGPEILNKYVGESEANIRNLFADAEREYSEKGDDSDLHLIIFDEIDAICKQRGTVNTGTGVNDSVVNQLLSKMDGVNSLNNILVIGMTNRIDLIDEALLRPGRFEFQAEIGLPDENGRLQILRIHTKGMVESKALGDDVDFDDIASRTKNYSGAELEGLVKSAASFALNRNIDINNLKDIPSDIGDKIKVTQFDFENALQEVKPAFGVSSDELESIVSDGIINYNESFERLKRSCESFVNQIKSGRRNLLSVLLEGAAGSGKTALAATIAKESEFPYLKIISPQNMVGFSETMKCNKITKIFDDAYKSPLSIIVLDDIERLIEYVGIGPRFSNSILQTLLVCIKKAPPKERKLLIIGTTSRRVVLESLELSETFNFTLNVPPLMDAESIRKVLVASNVREDMVNPLVQLIPIGTPIKKLLLAIEMLNSRLRENPDAGSMILEGVLHDCGLEIES